MIKITSHPSLRKPQEPTIALINIVFLMLIFFLIAGTLAPPLDPEISLADLETDQSEQMPDALAIFSDGRLSYRGQPVRDAEDFVGEALRKSADAGLTDKTIHLIPDRNLTAVRLLATISKLQAAGAERILLVAERKSGS